MLPPGRAWLRACREAAFKTEAVCGGIACESRLQTEGLRAGVIVSTASGPARVHSGVTLTSRPPISPQRCRPEPWPWPWIWSAGVLIALAQWPQDSSRSRRDKGEERGRYRSVSSCLHNRTEQWGSAGSVHSPQSTPSQSPRIPSGSALGSLTVCKTPQARPQLLHPCLCHPSGLLPVPASSHTRVLPWTLRLTHLGSSLHQILKHLGSSLHPGPHTHRLLLNLSLLGRATALGRWLCQEQEG